MHATHNSPTTVNPTASAPAEPTPADTLRKAADHLAAHGWVQRAYYDDGICPTPAACASGAIAIATYGYPHPEPHSHVPVDYDIPADLDAWHAFITAESFLELFLGLRLNDDDEPESLFEWNDVDTRTAEDVITTLRAAADAFTTGQVTS